MRKGRARRRSRVSSGLSVAAKAQALGTGTGLQVVVGLTDPRSIDGVPAESGPQKIEARRESIEATHVAAAKRSLEVVDESIEVVAAERSETSETPAEERSEEPKGGDGGDGDERHEGVEAGAKEPEPERAENPDEVSIPPIGDIAVERFFSEGDMRVHDHGEDESWEAAEKAKRKETPEIVERRARFAKYVKWAVAVAGVVCVAAVARTLAMPAVGAAPPRVAANAIQVEAPAPEALPVTPTPVTAVTAVTAVAAPETAAARSTSASASPSTSDTAATAAAAATPETKPADPTAARAEKKASQNALERGKLGDAIAAGERAVALDAEDGEAWLILGAAYQEKGDLANARRAYAACVKQGKTGPRNECAAMLR